MSQNVTLSAIISAAQSRRAGIEALASGSARQNEDGEVEKREVKKRTCIA
jgi:hypothetical protein